MKYPGKVIKEGESNTELVGAVVEQLTARLHLNTEEVALIKKEDDFGPRLAQFVKEFQTVNVDDHGRPLVQDGKIGALTWNALFENKPAMSNGVTTPELPDTAVFVAAQQSTMAVREKPRNSNKGPEVEAYLHSVGLAGGYPWCCAFVYWCFEQAALQLDMANPMVKTGGVLDHWNRAKTRNGARRITSDEAVGDPGMLDRGMIFIIDHGNSRGHTGLIDRVEGGWLQTIEGNTDASKTREGGGVYRLERKISEINKGFIAYQP